MMLLTLTLFGLVCALLVRLFPLRCRPYLLLAASLGFYCTCAAAGLPFILVTALSTYVGARVIERFGLSLKAVLAAQKSTLSRDAKKQIKAAYRVKQRIALIAVLVLNFGILSVLKYSGDLLPLFGASPLGLLLPLGISFYTFSSMGYLIDVYMGKYAAEKHFPSFLLYVSFFPQLIQGPIGRYDQLSAQLRSPQTVTGSEAVQAFMVILWGLFKKMVIADRALPVVNAVFSTEPGTYGGCVIVFGVLMYSLQQYCDFSGGIELVIGLARLMGVRLSENFRRPYFAVSLSDFWRRWHISLGSWMRDYVFYPFALTAPVAALSKAVKKPLGSSVSRALPAALGNLLVFLLVGLWHGASSNYLCWGLYNGVILAFSALAEPLYKGFNARIPRLRAARGYHVFRVLRTFLIVNIGWYFDRCAHAADALSMLHTTFTSPQTAQFTLPMLVTLGADRADYAVLALCTLLLFFVSLAQERGVVISKWAAGQVLPIRWAILLIGIMSIVLFGIWGYGFNEAAFIYFQF